MADAGRIGFVLKGNYDNTTQYERLDVVTHNNVLYAAKRDTIGNAPTGEDDDNWKVLIRNMVNGDFASKDEVPTLVKVDGTTITKDTDGTLHGSSEIAKTDYIVDTLEEAQSAIEAGQIEEGASVYVKEGANNTLGVATSNKVGLVKPDGKTVVIDEDGTLHGSDNIVVDDALSNTSKNPVQNKVIKQKIDSLQNLINNMSSGGDFSIEAQGTTIYLKDGDGNTISSTTTQDTTYSLATQSANGLLSSTDKKKIDNMGTQATFSLSGTALTITTR